MASLSDQVRRAIECSGESRYRITQETGVAESVLSRFMAGRSLNSDNLDRLAEHLGLELTTRKQRRDKQRRKD